MCASLAIAAFITIFLSTGGSGKADNDNLRSGQAHHAVDSVAVPTPPVSSSTNNYGSELDTTSAIMVDEEVVREAIDEASGFFKTVEEEELEKEDAVLVKEASGLGNSLRVRMGGIFSKSLTFAEMNAVANEVEEKLTQEAESELRDQADQMAEGDIESIENMVDAEEANGLETEEIEEDVHNQETAYTQELRVGIDEAADHVKLSMKKRAAEIEKEILEERLSIKMGKKVKLVIVDDEVQGVDELFTGLGNLAPNAAQPQTQGYYGAPPQQPATQGYYGAPTAQNTYGSAAAQPVTSTFGAAVPPQPVSGNFKDPEDYEDGEENAEEGSGGGETGGETEDNKSEYEGEEVNGGDDAEQVEEEAGGETAKKSSGWWHL